MKNKINKHYRDKLRNNPQFKIASRLRGQLHKNMKLQSAQKREKTLDLIGCSINYFCKHLEKQFDSKMTWDNHGTYWEIDHIYPISKADLTKDEEVKKVMHYTNFQPLEAIENRRKSNKLDWSPNE